MRTHTIEVPVELPADQVFAQVTDHQGRAAFLPESIGAVSSERVVTDADARRLAWREENGEPGGQVTVSDGRPGTCTVSIEVHTDRADEEVLHAELERAIGMVAQRALAEDSTMDTGRAWH